MNRAYPSLLSSVLPFAGATVLTGLFIGLQADAYRSTGALVLSGAIAGGKWLLQLAAAWRLSEKRRNLFIRNTGLVCLAGSALLFVYYLLAAAPVPKGWLFGASVGLSVLVMIPAYRSAVARAGLGTNWFLGWLFSVVVAITLQLTVVFHLLNI
ncbi:MAG: hypothetical protein EOO11_19825 [Chitinophagaceae bacterium]|nr:MAG: hypothetical protein EOO11_19825 [Chitinophagaceae bacterium]